MPDECGSVDGMSGGPWRSLAALTLARAAMGFQFQSVAAVAPLMASDLGLDKTQLGWLIGLYLLPGVACALPGGLLGRRYGDRRVVLVGLVLMAAGGVGLALARSVPEADIARFVTGAGAVILNVLLTKMVTDLFEGRDRLLAMSVLINAWPIGIGLALLVTGPLAALAGWRWGLGSAALFAVLGILFLVTVYRPPAAAPQAGSEGLGLSVLTRREWTLVAIAALPWMAYNAAYQIVLSFMPSFFVGAGLGIAHAGSLVALNTVLFVVSVQAGGFVLRRSARPDLVCHLAIVGWCVTTVGIAGGGAPLPWLVIGGLIGGCRPRRWCRCPASSCGPRAATRAWASSTRSTTSAAPCCRRWPAPFTIAKEARPRCGWRRPSRSRHRSGWRCSGGRRARCRPRGVRSIAPRSCRGEGSACRTTPHRTPRPTRASPSSPAVPRASAGPPSRLSRARACDRCCSIATRPRSRPRAAGSPSAASSTRRSLSTSPTRPPSRRR
jgi:MFS family permease